MNIFKNLISKSPHENHENEDVPVLEHHNNHDESIRRMESWSENSISILLIKAVNLISDIDLLYKISRVIHARIHRLKQESSK